MTIDDRGRRILKTAGLWGMALLAVGCASRWAADSAQPQSILQWPFAPNRPKVSYLSALRGFAVRPGASTTLRTLALGASKIDRGALLLPVAVATGRDGRIAVADLGRAAVHLFVPTGTRYLQLTGSGRGRLVSPVGVAFDAELTLYVTDSSGKLCAFAPDGSPRFVRTTAGKEPLRRPTGVAFNARNGAIYVVDTLANRVHAFAASGDILFSFGERGEQSGRFNFPTHVACSSAGELYVSDSLNFRIQIFDQRGGLRGGFGRHGDSSGDLAMPKGVAVDRDGVVYVADGLYSMGGVCPIGEVLALSRRLDFTLYIDDAHGTSIFGDHGEGSVLSALEGPLPDNLTVAFSLSKGFGCNGGGVLLPGRRAEAQVRTFGQTYAFSAPLDFSIVGAALKVLELHRDGTVKQLQRTLREKVELFDRLTGRAEPFSPIRMVAVGDDQKAIAWAERLKQQGFFVTVTFFPIVPRGEAQLRLCITVDHTDEDLTRLAAALADLK
jgi:DNA-binding beta-propeller fold protein YncE